MAAKRRPRIGAVAGVTAFVLGGCAERTAPKASVETVPARFSAPASAGAAPAASCAAALGRVRGSADEPDDAGTPIGLALLEEPGRDPVPLQLDLPIASAREPSEAEGSCLLLIELRGAPAEQRVVRRERVWSERIAAVERRLNPDYEAARRELGRLAERLDREERAQARELGRLRPTGEALIDVLGLLGGVVLGGIGSVARERELEEARARVEAIPRWVETVRTETYPLTVAEVELVRRAMVDVALVEPGGRGFRAGRVPRSRVDRVTVALDAHPRDRDKEEGRSRYLSPADLEALAAAPPPIALSELLPHLIELATSGPAQPGGTREARLALTTAIGTRLVGTVAANSTLAAARGPEAEGRVASAGSRAPAPAAGGSAHPTSAPSAPTDRPFARGSTGPTRPEPGRTARPLGGALPEADGAIGSLGHGSPSATAGAIEPRVPPAGARVDSSSEIGRGLVRVRGEAGEGHGFYLTPDKVVTPSRILGGSSLARIETADGFTTWGVVAGSRDAAGLVLLHVPRPGPPLLPAEAPAAPPIDELPEAGLPILRDGRVVAVSVDPSAGRIAGPEELARLLAALKGR